MKPKFVEAKIFPNALAEFAVVHADQTERDHPALVEAIVSGQIGVKTGI